MKTIKRGVWIAAGALLLIAAVLLIAASRAPRVLQSQYQAERWAGDGGGRFRQLACFLSPGAVLDREAVYTFRDKAARAVAAADTEEGADAVVSFCDAWSAAGSVKAAGPRGSFDAAALSVGGRFFDFHPMPLRSGGYLYESDLMHDRVVLDEQLAWMLFGAQDVAGMTVQIGKQEFLVAGVVAQPDDRFTRAVNARPPTLYLDDENRALLGDAPALTYEVVLPDPVRGFARGIVDETFGKLGAVVECTGRFSFAASLSRLGHLGQMGVNTRASVTPSWENAAVVAENRVAFLRLGALACLLLPAAGAAVLLYRGVRAGKRSLRTGAQRAWSALLDRRDARYERRRKTK